MKSTITISSVENNDILLKIFISPGNKDQYISIVKDFFLMFLWDIFNSSWKGWTDESKMNDRARYFIQRCMARDITLEECDKNY